MAPRSVPYLIVDAFTDRPFGGNPAGVVPDASGLADAQMQAIAREINLSETAFLTASTRSEARYRLRFFTPAREIALCGHATVATYSALAASGALKPGDRFLHETGAGLLPVEVRAGDAGGPLVFLGGEPWRIAPSPVDRATLARALRAPEAAIGTKLPPGLVCGSEILVQTDLATLDGLQPDLDLLAALSKAHGIIGVSAFAIESRTPGALTTLRGFFPAYGIPEDPVTGVANAALGGYLAHHGVVPFQGGTARFLATQGEHVGRSGLLRVEVEGAPGAVARTRVGGAARVVARGEFLL